MKAVEQARNSAWYLRNVFLVWCQVSHYYLRGFRRFRMGNMSEAKMFVGYETDLGDLKFRNDDIRRKYLTELGRFSRMDLRPSVTRKGWGLGSLRRSSVGQVALDYSTRYMDLSAIEKQHREWFLLYGTVGLGHWKATGPDGEKEDEFEVIPPWELMPLPASPNAGNNTQGIMRYRKVPLEWLRSKVEPSRETMKIPGSRAENIGARLHIEKVTYGGSPTNEGVTAGQADTYVAAFNESQQGRMSWKGEKQDKPTYQDFVPLTEVWLKGRDETCERYIAVVGDEVIEDIDYAKRGSRIPMPISISRFVPDSGFYSYGYVHMLMPGNSQMEKMLQNLYRNVEELDQFGTVFWPMSAGAGLKEFTKKNGRPKIVSYETDYSVPEAKPFKLDPANTGDFPGKVAAQAGQFQDTLAAQGPLFSGQSAGRVDSGSGMGFLFEVSQIALAASSHELANSWSQVYKSLLQSLKGDDDLQTLELMDASDDIAGVVLGEGGVVSLSENPLPNYWEVDIDVKDRQPQSKERRKAEVMESYSAGLVDKIGLKIINYKEDLNLPVDGRREFECYRKALYNNVILFGDGETPGDIDVNMTVDDPEIMLRAVRAFTARVEFSFAHKNVRASFEGLIKTLEDMLGGFPQQLPGPLDQTAMMEAGPGGVPSGMPGGMQGGMQGGM